ncbi:MAG: carboxypeptidase regulatory-like domain-containing protein [Acidobacteria bacterium]|nr:carboxypeptidase regulatory-like domain-containing protein [Acidobacteriota bacterium]
MQKLFLVVCLPLLAWAQTDTASLAVSIVDASGSRISQATAQLRSTQFGSNYQLASGTDGRLIFDRIRPGAYELTVAAQDFKRWTSKSIELAVAQTASLNVTLEVGAISESVTVSAEVSPLVSESASQGTVISERSIKGLALNGRQFFAISPPGSGRANRWAKRPAEPPAGRLHRRL